MERAPALPRHRRPRAIAWQIIGQYLPLAAFAAAAFLLIRAVAGDGGPSLPPATVAAGHQAQLAENIAFWEARAHELGDHLTLNRLSALYLQRLREAGDVADAGRAAAAAERALAQVPGDYASTINLALARVSLHEFREAERLARAAVAARPGRADAYAVLGDAQIALGDYASAEESYRTYLERAPGAPAFARQAAIAEVRGRLDLAEQFWLAAIDADRVEAPADAARARVQLGNHYLTIGRLDDGRRQFDAALRAYPGYAAAQAGLARHAAMRGDDERAIDRYRQALAAIPRPEYVVELGEVLQRAGREGEAARQFALVDVIARLYEAAGVSDELTIIRYRLDHGAVTPEIIELARQAFEARPGYLAADTYAWALYRADQLDAARAMAGQALAAGTQDPVLFYHAGMIALARGDTAGAAALLQRVQDLNPRFSVLHGRSAKDALARATGGTR